MDRAFAALACLAVLAGCTAPAAQGPAVQGPTEAEEALEPEGTLEQQTPASGSDALPVNASLVYDRVAASLDSDVAEPEIRTVDAEDAGATSYGGQLDPFHRLMLDADEREPQTPAAYYEPGAHRVTVLLHDGVAANATNESELRAVLAHEFAHAVTFRDERYRDPMTQAGRGTTTDAARLRTAMVEGSAMYVSDEYSERYLDGFDHGRAMARDYRGGDELWRYLRGPYRFGGRYFDRRLDSPANLTRAFRTPPETTEQLIHGFAPGEEPPADLRVDVAAASGEGASAGGEDANTGDDGTGDGDDGTDDGEDVNVGRTDTTGELFVRDLLGGRLSERRAASAAAGWGNDRVVTVWNHGATESNQRTFAWALRWDDEENATEFERAFADYLDARGERVGDGEWRVAGERFRLVRASDRTVAVVIGGPEAVEGVEIAADDGEVSVTA